MAVILNYTTVDNLRDFTQFENIITTADLTLVDIISVAESIVDGICRQSFTKEAATKKVIDGTDLDILPLPKRLYALTTLEMDDYDYTDTVGVFLKYGNTHSSIQYDSGLAINERLRYLVTDTQQYGHFFVGGKGNVEITGDWGWPTVPEDIRIATNFVAERVALSWREGTRNETLKISSERLGDYQWRKESEVSQPKNTQTNWLKQVIGMPTQLLLSKYLWMPIGISVSS